jgi:hypothetical protein
MAVEDAQRLLSQRALTLNQLAQLEMLLQKSQAQEGLHLALLSERAAMVSVFDLPAKTLEEVNSQASGDEPGIAHVYRAGRGFLAASGLADRDRRLVLETMEQGIALSDDDSPAALEQFESVYTKAAEKAGQFPQRIFSAMLPSQELEPDSPRLKRAAAQRWPPWRLNVTGLDTKAGCRRTWLRSSRSSSRRCPSTRLTANPCAITRSQKATSFTP